MTITKYTHACFSVEKDGECLVIDPGAWSSDFNPSECQRIVGVVITHEHADHMDAERIQQILQHHPSASVYANADVAQKLTGFPVHTITSGENVHVGKFALYLTGGDHAQIDTSIARITNLGVIIDDELYYPGDSFALPDQTITTLALPISAPWMKFSEAADFLRAVQPRRVFPTHDAILSDSGKGLADRMFGAICAEIGATYTRLSP